MHFHVCISVLSLFYQSWKRQLMRKERHQELIHAPDQKSADRITKVNLVLTGWGTSRSRRDLSATGSPSSLLSFWSLAGHSDWLWLESTRCLPLQLRLILRPPLLVLCCFRTLNPRLRCSSHLPQSLLSILMCS